MKRGFRTVALVLVVLLIIGFAAFQARKTDLGRIKQSKMAEPHPPTKIQEAVSKAKQALHLSTADTRRKDYLKVGPSQMEWSLQSTTRKTGWLYFHKPESNDPIWEFAPCARTNLQDVTTGDVQVKFLRTGDPRIESLFPSDFRQRTGLELDLRAVPVSEGQIVLARLLQSSGKAYAIKFTEQNGTPQWGSVRIEYVEFDSPDAESALKKFLSPATPKLGQ